MKRSIILILVLHFLLWTQMSLAATQSEYNTEFFEAAKIYTQKDYALNDALEFSIFDMSEIKILNDAKEIKTDKVVSGLAEVNSILEKLPRIFYRKLKKEILTNKVPVKLYAAEAPSYSKALELQIKIKTIYLKETLTHVSGSHLQPITMRIFGQITDKATNEVLIKFYDFDSAEFLLGKEEAKKTFDKMAGKMMKNLALFLRAQY